MYAASLLASAIVAGARSFNPGFPPAQPGHTLAMSVTASVVLVVIPLLLLWLAAMFVGAAHIPNDRVGVLEKLWSLRGSVGGGRIMASAGEAGYQAHMLRGGLHFGLWRWQYRIHRAPLVTVPQGKIAYVYARDGEPLTPGQTLGRDVSCANFQDAGAFITGEPAANRGLPPAATTLRGEDEGAEPARGTQYPALRLPGQRGRQRAILREGVYAINLALFVVIAEDRVYHLGVGGKDDAERAVTWQRELKAIRAFDPVVVGGPVEAHDPLVGPEKTHLVDSIGVITVHDGPSLSPGEIIAPAVGNDPGDANYHNNFQDPDAFLRAGGRRGRQYVPLTDGTYFVNRWFATVELMPKTVVPIGYVGVVVSYCGPIGNDVSGDAFRHGERVARGERGVWERPLGPGKYPFNTYAGQVILVPTTNFVLHWVTGRTEAHRYDDSLKSIDLVTKDAYEPMLPLSVVVHIDYMRAPSVIQRFGDVKKLITQTLDPMLSAYFRDIAHKKTMLELLHDRDAMRTEARAELQSKFREFDIECVDVLIGKPGTGEMGGKVETLLEQLRQRQLSIEQIETFSRQREAADEQKKLNEAQALAAKQAELTASHVQVRIAENAGEADLARARMQAQQAVVMAEAELERSRRQAEQTVVTAEAESRQRTLAGEGEATRVSAIGRAEAAVLANKVDSYGDPRLYALALVAEHLSRSTQPLVPSQVFVAGGAGAADGANGSASPASGGGGMMGMLLNLLVAERLGFDPTRRPAATGADVPANGAPAQPPPPANHALATLEGAGVGR